MENQNNNIHYTIYNTTVIINPSSEQGDWQLGKEKPAGIGAGAIGGEDRLYPVIRLLVAALAPAQIYRIAHPPLITPLEEACIDLLLIIPARCTTAFTELEPVLGIAGINNPNIFCSLHNEGNVREALKAGHPFYTLALQKENRVYDSGEIELPCVTAEAFLALKSNLLQTFNSYDQKAKQFHHSATLLLQQGAPLALFMLQQAAELIMRGLLVSCNGYDKKTHELRSLKKHLRRCAPQLHTVFPDNTEEETRLLSLLESAYLGARYTPGFTCNEPDARCLHQRVDTLLQTAALVKDALLEMIETSIGK